MHDFVTHSSLSQSSAISRLSTHMIRPWFWAGTLQLWEWCWWAWRPWYGSSFMIFQVQFKLRSFHMTLFISNKSLPTCMSVSHMVCIQQPLVHCHELSWARIMANSSLPKTRIFFYISDSRGRWTSVRLDYHGKETNIDGAMEDPIASTLQPTEHDLNLKGTAKHDSCGILRMATSVQKLMGKYTLPSY